MELKRKMYRDVKDNFLQFFSIFLIAALGVFAYSGLNSSREGLIESMERYYEETNIPDAWIYVQNPTPSEVESISNIGNVQDVQTRLVYTYNYDNKELELIVSDKNILSKPYLIKGEEYETDKFGLWIDRDFASENNYEVGDFININNTNVEIKGIVLSSEKIYAPPSGEVITDFAVYGYAYMTKTCFTELFGVYEQNQIIIATKDKTADAVKKTISDVKILLEDDYYTHLLQEDNSSINHITERKRQLLQFTYIFPALFYFLALLTMLTTMKRIIEKQRIQIATMMSMGYSNWQIMGHYMSYGLWTGLLGGIVGAAAGYLIIPDVLIKSFRHLAMVPYWNAPFTIESILAVFGMVLVCIFAIILSCYEQLKIMPAIIFRGNGTRILKHILLEKSKVWDSISFKGQMMLRNIIRNRVRTTMGIIGVLGSVVLVLAGLGMKDSFDYTVDATYNDFYKYNSKVQILDSTVSGDDISLDDDYQYIEENQIEIKSSNEENADQIQSIITVVDEGKYVYVPKGSNTVNVSTVKGLIISEKLADVLGVSEGEEIYWRYAIGDWKPIKVGMIVESALPRVAFASLNTWEENGETFTANAILTSMESSDIKGDDKRVRKVLSIESQEASFQKVCDSSKSIVYIMIFAAVLLVVVVLVNLGVMNFTEMYRDYATLKVLGLYPKEIGTISFVENLVLTSIGWLIGIPVAYKFVEVYMQMLSNDTLVCLSKVNNSSFLISSAIILLCSFGVNIILSTKLRTISMVEALKANE